MEKTISTAILKKKVIVKGNREEERERQMLKEREREGERERKREVGGQHNSVVAPTLTLWW